MVYNKIAASFRDPTNQVYQVEEQIVRVIMGNGVDAYKYLMSSGLYDKLASMEYIIPHTEDSAHTCSEEVVIRPQKVNFISYPYEWCFSQLKDAALLTLELTKIALQHNMILKDASAYNIQFYHGKPLLIDTGSFAFYDEGAPWFAYKQFCMQFLGPLALMSKKDIRFGLLSRQFIDGMPLDFVSNLLSMKNKITSPSLFVHIHAHAKAQKKFSNCADGATTSNIAVKRRVSKTALLGLLENLSTLIKKLHYSTQATEWGDYYANTNYNHAATNNKISIVQQITAQLKPKMIWDLGGNDGFYSRIAAQHAHEVVVFDIDPMAVELNYQKTKQDSCKKILPLLQDLMSPSTSIGWGQNERSGLQERGKADLVMALALIHHLVIANNVPLARVASYFATLSDYLLIEFVPKQDSQVQRLLYSRVDIFNDYHLDGFKKAFSLYYCIEREMPIEESDRVLFFMKRIQS